MAIKVFNADDHPILRKGVTDLIVETDGLEWVGSAENGKEALDKIRSIVPDVAILDIEMPHITGLEVARKLLDDRIKTEFILLTLFKNEDLLQNAIKLGIKGYLLKESSTKEIIDCIHSVYKGQAYVNPQLTQYLIKRQNIDDLVLESLSDHEVNILKLIARKKTSAEIADMLFISPKTVSNHRTNISKKLKLSGEQNSLLKWALDHKHILK